MDELELPLADAAALCGVPVKNLERALRSGDFPEARTLTDDGPWHVRVRDLRAAGYSPAARRLGRWRREAQKQGVWGTDGLRDAE